MTPRCPLGLAVFAEVQITGHCVADDASRESVLQALTANRQHRLDLYLVAVDHTSQFPFEGPPHMRARNLVLVRAQKELVRGGTQFILNGHVPPSGELDTGRSGSGLPDSL